MYSELFDFKSRLQKVFSEMEPSSLFLIDSNPVYNRTSDQDYLYRPNSYMLYLIGFEEPNSHLLLSKDKDSNCNTFLFVQPRNPERETWTGKIIGTKNAEKIYAIDKAFKNSELAEWFAKNSLRFTKLYYSFGNKTPLDSFVLFLLTEGIKSKSPEGPGISIIEKSTNILDSMRLIKDDKEIEIMKKTCEISAEAHIKAMEFIKPSVKEYEVENTINSYFRSKGAEGPAYPSICATGNNAATLHYITNNETCKDGELFLLDAGSEFKYYSADITRTYPVSGKFTELQAKLYEIVLKAQKEAINACVVGNTYQKVHNLTLTILVEGLIKLGILKGDAVKLIEDKKYMPYYMHGTGHWLGLDTHDVGGRKIMVNDEFVDRSFEPGMIITIEPGLYFSSSIDEIPDEFKGIGIRIEDDILITKEGPLNLTAKVPKEISEIESLMKKNKS